MFANLIENIISAMKFHAKYLLTLIVLILTACGSHNAPLQPESSDNNLAYIENKGSDTIVNLALAWAEAYQKINPNSSFLVVNDNHRDSQWGLFPDR